MQTLYSDNSIHPCADLALCEPTLAESDKLALLCTANGV